MIQQRLRQERLRRGLTLADLASMTGIAAPNLSRLETGQVDPRASTLARVLGALGLRLSVEPIPQIALADVKARMEAGAARLRAAGLPDRNVERRLAWKEQRGEDTDVERKLLGGI